jgi:hypothetical protein
MKALRFHSAPPGEKVKNCEVLGGLKQAGYHLHGLHGYKYALQIFLPAHEFAALVLFLRVEVRTPQTPFRVRVG